MLTLLVAISLLLRALFYLVDMVVDYFSPSDAIEVNINWAFNYLYDIITAAIYLGVTGIALMGASPAPVSRQTIRKLSKATWTLFKSH